MFSPFCNTYLEAFSLGRYELFRVPVFFVQIANERSVVSFKSTRKRIMSMAGNLEKAPRTIDELVDLNLNPRISIQPTQEAQSLPSLPSQSWTRADPLTALQAKKIPIYTFQPRVLIGAGSSVASVPSVGTPDFLPIARGLSNVFRPVVFHSSLFLVNGICMQ